MNIGNNDKSRFSLTLKTLERTEVVNVRSETVWRFNEMYSKELLSFVVV